MKFANDKKQIKKSILTYTNEKIILVDPDDNMLGEIEKIRAHEYAMLHRAFSVLIFRHRQGKIETLMQQRNEDKYHSGGLWTNTSCGHPHLDEDLVKAGEARLKYEMGIECKLYEIGKFHYIASLNNALTENEIEHVLIGTYEDEEVPFNPQEVSSHKWIEADTLLNRFDTHAYLYTPWFRQALELALPHLEKVIKNSEGI